MIAGDEFKAEAYRDGEVLWADTSPKNLPVKPKPPEPRWTDRTSSDTTYYFKDWSGDEDVLILARRCTEELKAFVADGVAKGFLTTP